MPVTRHSEMGYTFINPARYCAETMFSRGKKMNKLSIAAIVLGVLILSGQVNEALAVSPQPSEIGKDLERKAVERVKPGEGEIVCTVVIKYMVDPKTGRNVREDYSMAVAVKHTANKKDAAEEALTLIEDKLNDENISEIAVDCRFPKTN